MSTRFVVQLETGNSYTVGGRKIAKGQPLTLTAGDPFLAYFRSNRRFSVTELPGPRPVSPPESAVVEKEPEPEPDDNLDDEEPEPEPDDNLDDEEPEPEPDDVPEWTSYGLREMKRAELASLAEKLGFDVRSSDRKAELIAAIESTRG